jgi:hypothetical protein
MDNGGINQGSRRAEIAIPSSTVMPMMPPPSREPPMRETLLVALEIQLSFGPTPVAPFVPGAGGLLKREEAQNVSQITRLCSKTEIDRNNNKKRTHAF